MRREENGDVKVKHACKFCDKSFPSGRQLGGHMRSHQNHNSSVSEPDGIVGEKIQRKKIRVRIKKMKKGLDLGENFECRLDLGYGGSRGAYVLRENPRKSWRIVADESSEDMSSDRDKSCREWGRGFGSCKAFFGPMKKHTLEDRDSRTSDDQREMAVPPVGEEDRWLEDEDEEMTAMPCRRRKGYMVAEASSSSLSLVNNNEDGNEGGNHNNTASSVSEIDQEQEEVAMCLMMLSRDVGQWKVMDSVVAMSSKGKMPSPDAKKVSSSIRNSVSNNLDAKYEVRFQSRVDRRRDRKRPLSSSSDLNDFDQGVKTQKEFLTSEVGLRFISGIGVNSDKRTKFECSTCNKVFHSYQALGGHKASHSKIKDCFSAKSDSNDDGIKIQTFRPTNNIPGTIEWRTNEIVWKKHECPVCLKVFPSGQALGGHKRSHMQQGSRNVHNTRDTIDLNLPAQIEDEGSSHVTFSSWGVGSSSHSQEEPIAGL